MSERTYPWQINFWRPKLVAEKFEHGILTSVEKVTYMIIGLVLWTAGYEIAYLIPSEGWTVNMLEMAVPVIATASVLFGSLYLYYRHTSRSSFIEKYMVVGTAAIPFLVLIVFVPIGLLTHVLYAVFYENIPMELTWLDIISAVAMSIGMYWMLSRYFN